MKAMLEPRMVAATTQPPFVGDGSTHGFARITASSQGGLAILAMIHSQRGRAVQSSGGLSLSRPITSRYQPQKPCSAYIKYSSQSDSLLDLCETSIHKHLRSGDVAAVVRRQKHNSAPDLVGGTEPAE